MKQVIVGVFEFGHGQVQLVLREGTGGEFYTMPEKGALPRIKVGADYGKWVEVVSILLHEAMESAMLNAHLRFNPDNRVRPLNQADYLFVMDHQQFHDCVTKMADFLVPALPALASAWKKWHAKPAPKPKRKARKK